MQVSFKSCCEDLLRPGALGAHYAIQRWRGNSLYRDVIPFVENFTHRYLFELGNGTVRDIVARSSHALGDVQSTEQLEEVENFHTPFALQHLFHWYVEAHRSLPTWTEFRDWMVLGDAAPHWHQLLKLMIGPNPTDEKRFRWARAARWRLGKFYLSTMREIDLLVQLRAEGLDARYHILADVLFRADFWVGNLIVSLYFPNPNFRQGKEQGRKPPAEKFFEGATPQFQFVHFPVDRQGFGNVWWASDVSIRELKKVIEQNAWIPTDFRQKQSANG
jgi:hypothetical protein